MLADDQSFYFLEMNTRLQVEHLVTEQVYGVDLVRASARRRGRAPLRPRSSPAPWPARSRHGGPPLRRGSRPGSLLPATGSCALPLAAHARRAARHGFTEGDAVSIHYDPMLAKLITWGDDREHARARMAAALAAWEVHGVVTNPRLPGRRRATWPTPPVTPIPGFTAEHWPDGWERPAPSDDQPLAAAVLRARVSAERDDCDR
ncbi:MAG: hypothetical protein U1F43_11890 [Myxococcota bacterium]